MKGLGLKTRRIAAIKVNRLLKKITRIRRKYKVVLRKCRKIEK